MKKNFKNQKGMSLIEVIVAGAMVSGIVFVTFTLQKNVQHQLVNIGEQTDIIVDQAGAFRAINEDLSFSDPSFNFVNSGGGINQRDDFWTLTSNELGERSLEIVSENECLNFFAVDKSKTLNTATGTVIRKNTLLIKPSFFYKPRTSMSDPLIYDSTKIASLLTDNQLAVTGQLIKVSGMAPVFVSGASNNYYRDYGLLLKIDSGTSTSVVSSSSSSVSFFANPTTGSCTSNNSNLDQFLRCLPTPGGGATSFFITPVVPISYCLKKANTGEIGYQLYRKKGESNVLIASGVEYLKLVRLNSTNAIININLQFCPLRAQSGICKK